MSPNVYVIYEQFTDDNDFPFPSLPRWRVNNHDGVKVSWSYVSEEEAKNTKQSLGEMVELGMDTVRKSSFRILDRLSGRCVDRWLDRYILGG